MASKEAGIAVAIIGAIGVIVAACLSSGAYTSLCPPSLCGGERPEQGVNNTCIQGYVWREATPTDHVCVTP